MNKNGKKLGMLLLDANVITKRQISKAIQKQQKGDNRKLGEILIELGYITIEDLTDVMIGSGHEVKAASPVQHEPQTELSEDTKFNISIKTMISAAAGVATLVGFYYMMMGEIDDAKRLPEPGIGSYPALDLRDPTVAWPPSKHQYNDQYDNIIDAITDMEEEVEELNDKIRNLELKVARLEK